MRKLFLTGYYYQDSTCDGWILELWNLEKDECLLTLDLTDPYDWRNAQFLHLRGILITPEVEDYELLKLPSDRYDTTACVLLLNPDVVIDEDQRYRIINVSDLTDAELKRLGKYTTLAKEEYLRRLKERYQKAIESL